MRAPTELHRCTACTNPSPVNARCGTFPTARWRSGAGDLPGSEALGWNIVPHTIIRDGPAGRGMLQVWVDQPGDSSTTRAGATRRAGPGGPVPGGSVPPGYLSVLQAYDFTGDEVMLIHADDTRLRRMAVFDILVNNADRKGGHILRGVDGGVYGVDHGLCLHIDDKLRTVLWGWAGKPIDDDTLESVAALTDALDDTLSDELTTLITPREVRALRRRALGC